MLEPFRKLSKLDKFVWRILTSDLKQRSSTESNAIKEHQSHFPAELKESNDKYFKDVNKKTKHANAFFDKNNIKSEISASPYFYVAKRDENGNVINKEDIMVSYYRDQVEGSSRVAQKRDAPAHGITEDGHISFYEKTEVQASFAKEFAACGATLGVPALAYYTVSTTYSFVGLYLGLPILAVGTGAASYAFLQAYDALTGKNNPDANFARRVYRVAFANDGKTVELKFANGEKVLIGYENIKEYGYKSHLNAFITEHLNLIPAYGRVAIPKENMSDEDLMFYFKREFVKNLNSLVEASKTGEGESAHVRLACKAQGIFIKKLRNQTQQLPIKRFSITKDGKETPIFFEAHGLEALRNGKAFLETLTKAETSQKLPAGTFYKKLQAGNLDMNEVENRTIEEYLYDSDQETKAEIYSKYRKAGDEDFLKDSPAAIDTEDAWTLYDHKNGQALADARTEGEVSADFTEMRAGRRSQLLKDDDITYDAKLAHWAYDETVEDHRRAVQAIGDKLDSKLLQLTDLSLDKAKAARGFSGSRQINDVSVAQYMANTGFDATSVAEVNQAKMAYAHESAHGTLRSVLKQAYKDSNYRTAGKDSVAGFKNLTKA